MSDHLKLACSFRLQDYRHVLRTTFRFDPENNHLDHLYRYNPDYPEYRESIYPQEKDRTVRALLHNGGVTDYHMFLEGSKLSLYLKTDEDMMIATAALMPEKIFTTDFLECSKNNSARKMKKRAKKLQQLFDQTSLRGHVTFSIDSERKYVRATAEGTHFIRLFGIAREIERAIGQHFH